MTHQEPPIDALRLSERDRQRLLEMLDHPAFVPARDIDRRRLRVPFRTRHLFVTFQNIDEQTVTFSVSGRNISTFGIAFAHGNYVHPNSPALVLVPRRDGRWVRLAGRVSRCRHVSRHVHEVSVAFEEPIDLVQYVELTEQEAAIAGQELAPAQPGQRSPTFGGTGKPRARGCRPRSRLP